MYCFILEKYYRHYFKAVSLEQACILFEKEYPGKKAEDYYDYEDEAIQKQRT